MATARRRTVKTMVADLGIEVDERTREMSFQALICRGRGHRWEDVALPRSTTLDNLQNGIMEYRKQCKCGQKIREVWSIRQRARIHLKREYPKNNEYLVPKGSGRLRKGDAWAAGLVRELTYT